MDDQVISQRAARAKRSLSGNETSARGMAAAVDADRGEQIRQHNLNARSDELRAKFDESLKISPQRKSSANQSKGGVIPEYRKGGSVRKTGLAKLHKGERVLTVSQAKRFGRIK